MTMNRIHIYLLLFVGLAAGLMNSGCKRDFLEKPKGDAVTVDTIFHTQQQARYAVARMYELCIMTGFVKNEAHDARPDVITDQLYIIHPGYDWAASNVSYSTYITGNMTPSATIDRDRNNEGMAFLNHYKGIRQANLVLKNIGMVTDADDGWKADVRGQALFCRAMQHYEVFRLYGGIPIVSEPLAGDGAIAIPRSSVRSVVDSIVSWCDQAAFLLPATRPSVEWGKVTSLAAKALKARILLYAASPLFNTPDNMRSVISAARFGDGRDSVLCYATYDKERWKKAADAAKDVLDNAAAAGVVLFNENKPLTTGDAYSTIGDYEAVYNNVDHTGKYGNPEYILANTYNQVPNGWEWGRYMMSKVRLAEWGVKNNVPIEFMQLYEKRDGTQWTMPQSGTDFPVDFKALNLDPRLYQSVAYDGQYFNSSRGTLAYYLAGPNNVPAAGNLSSSDAGPDGYAVECVKFVARVDNMNDNHFAWPIFRLAEFYLSYAEAMNEYAGPGGLPTDYLNLVRARAGMPVKTPASQDEFRNAIQNERTVELAWEGHRYSDLTRWLKAHTVLSQFLHGVSTTGKKVGTVTTRTWQVVPFVQRSFPIKYYYIPFPYSEVSKNYLGGSNWNGQNPGW